MVNKKAKIQARKTKNTKFGVVNYPVGDFLIQIKNAALAKKRDVDNRGNKFVNEIAKVLKKEGILDEVTLEKGVLMVRLAFRKKNPVLMNLKLLSKPGLRIYWGVDELEKQRGPSSFILSTPEGILSSKEAIKKKGRGGRSFAKYGKPYSNFLFRTKFASYDVKESWAKKMINKMAKKIVKT